VAIVFLTLDEVIEIHHDQMQRHGGDATLRDLGLLQSAVATPQAAFGGQFADPPAERVRSQDLSDQ
jgi:death-on-curing protein